MGALESCKRGEGQAVRRGAYFDVDMDSPMNPVFKLALYDLPRVGRRRDSRETATRESGELVQR